MGVYAELVDFDQEFERVGGDVKVINDFNTSIPEEKEALDRCLYTHYQNTDTIESSASCNCGYITEVCDIGSTCPICKSKVTGTADKPIESELWLRAPDGIVGLISPEVWMILEPALSVTNFSFLEYLTNRSYRYDPTRITSKETTKKIDKLLARNLPRGLNEFITNFDEIIEFLFTANIIDSSKANKTELWEFIQTNKHLFFPKHLPIPSRICFVVESTTSGIYMDLPLKMAFEAVYTMASIRSSVYPLSPQVVQHRTVSTIIQLARFYGVYTKERIAKKPGAYRRHVFGSSLHFTGRGVITSIHEPHYFNELHIPWGMACQLLKYHIINKLRKRGYSASKSLEFVYTNVQRYNPLLDQIFQELIAESHEGRLWCLLSRNPTLQRGSMQFFGISKVKTDIHDQTISMPHGALRAPN